MKKSYLEKLKDPRWQKRRLEVLEYFGWECCACGSKEKTLTVHHKQYLKNCEPWDYPDGYLISLCEDCHEAEREAQKSLNVMYHLLQVKFSPRNLLDIFKELLQHPVEDKPESPIPEQQEVV